jgi:tetratricopeptide (TPR) repeat protein
LVESLLSYLGDMGSAAPDKMRRARALSQAAGLSGLHALSSAWLAQMDYNKLDVESMAKHVGESLRIAPADHHSARSRASMVVAQALHLAGQMELASPWYKRAREHAVADGDEATTSAWMHNMAWLRMHMHRQAVLTGNLAGIAGSHALMGINSTIQYDVLQGIATLEPLKPILQAQIFALEGKPDRALALFDAWLSAQPKGMARLNCTLLADRAWCLVEQGRLDEALEAAIEVELSFEDDTQVDDRAVVHSRLAQVFAAVGESAKSESHLISANLRWSEFAELQNKLRSALGSLSEFGSTS